MEVQNIDSYLISSTQSVNTEKAAAETVVRSEEVKQTETVADNRKGNSIDSYA